MKRLFSHGNIKISFITILKIWLRKNNHHKLESTLFYPGVITQQVSCEIELSPWNEAILDCIPYFTMAVAVAISGILAHRYSFVRNSLHIHSGRPGAGFWPGPGPGSPNLAGAGAGAGHWNWTGAGAGEPSILPGPGVAYQNVVRSWNLNLIII